jgi:hypothetical protein
MDGMARLCIRIAPNDHPTDPSQNALRTRPGDVVEIGEDGHVWEGETAGGQYRFIDVPGVSRESLLNLMSPVRDGAGRMTRRFTATLDISVLNNVTWIGRTSATKAQVDAITIPRT